MDATVKVPAIGNEPFAVLLPDDLLLSRGQPVLAQMAEAAARLEPAGLVAVDKSFREGKPVTTIHLTDDGRQRLSAHVAALVSAIGGFGAPAAASVDTREAVAVTGGGADDGDWVD